MRLLFIAPYTPTPIRTRSYHLVRTLAQRGHQVTLAVPWETSAELAGQAQWAALGVQVLTARLSRAQIGPNVLAALGRAAPLQAHYSWVPALAQAIVQHLNQAGAAYDVVHVEHLRGAEYGRLALKHLRATGRSQPVVWDSVDCISLLFEQAASHSRSRLGRWVARLELPRTRRYERRVGREFSGVLAASRRDADTLEQLSRRAEPLGARPPSVRVLPNGVDSAYFCPAAEPAPTAQVVLTGKMSYHANVTAAMQLVDDIMPRVWQRRPDVEVVIAGSAPARGVRQLARRHAPRVRVTGYVPDLRPYLRAAAVAAAPLAYGAGIQNKVLEAMACATPVVASPQACAALRARPGTDIWLAAEPADFAQALLHLLDQPATRRALGDAGRAYVVAHHQWDHIVSDLEGYYDEFAGTAADQPL